MVLKKKKVKPIEEANGEIHFNLACDEANADWLKSQRLITEEKFDEVEEMSKNDTYKFVEDNE